MKTQKTFRVENRTGFWWGLFCGMFFAVALAQVALYWIGKGFTGLSDLLRELCYRVWFKGKPKEPGKSTAKYRHK